MIWIVFNLILGLIYINIGNTTKDRDLNNMYRIKNKELSIKRFLIHAEWFKYLGHVKNGFW